jgi:chromosome segregation ATPase
VHGLQAAIDEQSAIETTFNEDLQRLSQQREELQSKHTTLQSKHAELEAERTRAESKVKSAEELTRDIEAQCEKVSALEETHAVTLGMQLWKFTELTGSTLACVITHPDR